MDKAESGPGQTSEFKVNREHWADHTIYYGAKVHVSKAFEKEKLSGAIVGLSEFNYLIIEIPIVIGHRARYAPGSTVIVKFAKDATVYGFYSEVLQIQYEPSPLMFLKYPNELESFEFREHKRFMCNIPARLYSDTGQYYCLINDISRGGCNLSVYQADVNGGGHLTKQQPARIVLSLFGLGDIELGCQVRGVDKGKDSLSFGVQFETDGVPYGRIMKYLEMLHG